MKQIGKYALLIATFVVPGVARAEMTWTVKPGENENEFAVVRMTVTPAAEPVPALKHRLTTRDIDLRAGNAAPYYYRAFLETQTTMDRLQKEFGEDFDAWYIAGNDGTPLSKLPLEKVRKAVEESTGGVVGDQLKEANKRRDCDWELDIDQLSGPNLFAFMLEEFQRSRQTARMLMLRTRLAVAEHRYDDALDSMRMNYRLAHDVATVPLLVNGLIAIAIESSNNQPVMELISSPGSPNLYWALSELPQPAIDLKPAFRFEMEFGRRMLPYLYKSETTDHSPEEWNRLYVQSLRDLAKVDDVDLWGKWFNSPHDVVADIAATGLALVGYPHAKESLIAQGMDRERVEKMSVGQVMAIYTERTYRRSSDDLEKFLYIPYSEAIRRKDVVEKRLEAINPLGGGPDREVIPLASLLLPAVQTCRTAQIKLEREMASLRVIEALRMYAADHEGKLPAALDDITAVPVPVNPATLKPFVYQLKGDIAVLELPVSDGINKDYRRYEIQIANDKK